MDTFVSDKEKDAQIIKNEKILYTKYNLSEAPQVYWKKKRKKNGEDTLKQFNADPGSLKMNRHMLIYQRQFKTEKKEPWH